MPKQHTLGPAIPKSVQKIFDRIEAMKQRDAEERAEFVESLKDNDGLLLSMEATARLNNHPSYAPAILAVRPDLEVRLNDVIKRYSRAPRAHEDDSMF